MSKPSNATGETSATDVIYEPKTASSRRSKPTAAHRVHVYVTLENDEEDAVSGSADWRLDLPAGVSYRVIANLLDHVVRSRTAVTRVAEAMAAQEQPVGPNTAAQLARADLMWRHLIETYGTYSSADIADMRGGKRSSRSIATNLAREHNLIGFMRGTAKAYPRFEFLDSKPNPWWSKIVTPLRASGVTDQEILLWMVASNAYLGGEEPAAMLAEEPERVVALADAEAAGRWS